jgi:hypothetical protein
MGVSGWGAERGRCLVAEEVEEQKAHLEELEMDFSS